MLRDELTDDNATWNIPGARTKNGRPHVVPLPPLARQIIKAAAGKRPTPLCFTTNGKSPVSGWSKLKARLDRAMAIPQWRLHDLRRTAATGMAEIGIPPHIVEACLNHISGAKAGVAGTYNRAAYAAEKRAALERWAAHVEGLIGVRPAATVVPLHRA
jgi:integrase